MTYPPRDRAEANGECGASWDHAPCGLVVARADGTLVALNPTLLGWTGRVTGAPGRMPELFTVPGALFYETHCAPLLRLQGFVAEISLELRRLTHGPIVERPIDLLGEPGV